MNGLTINLLHATECAALESIKVAGYGSAKDADSAAVFGMRQALNEINFGAKIVIGEGERDKAPMLHIGEMVGRVDDHQYDIAVDPLEGTTICANYGEGALSVIGFAKKGGILCAPDVYMEKIVIGKSMPNGVVSLKNTVKDNLSNLAQSKNCLLSDLIVVMLKRERHEKLAKEVRETGAKIKFIEDGDISAILLVITQDDADIYLGSGGAPEGVLSAIAVNSLGGFMEGQLIFSSNEEKEKAKNLGIKNLEHIYSSKEMASSDSQLIITGITDGKILPGIKNYDDYYAVSSLIILNNQMLFLTHNIKKI